MFATLLVLAVIFFSCFFAYMVSYFEEKKEVAFYVELTKNDHLYNEHYDENGYNVRTLITSLLID